MSFQLRDRRDVADVYRLERPDNLIGFYQVDRSASGRTTVKPLGLV